MADGKFIVFEGIDGSGTTTQSKAAAQWLRSRGVDVVETHEPTDGPVGRIIRQALKRKLPGREGEEIEPQLFALLFAADRMHHMTATVVRELQEFGRWVVSDRCYLSSFAYQSVGCDLDWVRSLNRHVRRPDLTLLLDIPADAAYERIARRTLFNQLEVFETPEMMGKVQPNYVRIARQLTAEGERIVTIDASRPVGQVAEEVRNAIGELS